jgi:hypothetical protein
VAEVAEVVLYDERCEGHERGDLARVQIAEVGRVGVLAALEGLEPGDFHALKQNHERRDAQDERRQRNVPSEVPSRRDRRSATGSLPRAYRKPRPTTACRARGRGCIVRSMSSPTRPTRPDNHLLGRIEQIADVSGNSTAGDGGQQRHDGESRECRRPGATPTRATAETRTRCDPQKAVNRKRSPSTRFARVESSPPAAMMGRAEVRDAIPADESQKKRRPGTSLPARRDGSHVPTAPCRDSRPEDRSRRPW